MESYRSLPKLPGVYLFKNTKGEIIYIGKAKSLRDRVGSYFSSNLLPKTALLVSEIVKIGHIITTSEIDALILEANLIRKYQPHYNVNWKDGKNYPLIEITINEKIPIVKIVRQETNSKALYFGPYPTGSDLFSLFKFLRRIFPFVSQKHRFNQTCLRSHLELCPCPDYENYKQTIKQLILFLSGQRLKIQKNLSQEMISAAQNKDFELANKIKERLEQLNYVTAPRNKPWEYELNPNLTSDRYREETDQLKKVLNLTRIEKIECYDISNTNGKLATGAQVTFVNGLPEKSLYRRYRIIKSGADTDMTKEIISRRLKSQISLPELIIIDGGKEHLLKAPIPVISLAKRLETIYYQNKIIQLPTNSPALHLIQRLRDEAHRFSRKYHIWLRAKNMLA